MEEFKHMIVEEFTEEDFYETIEAPKFVDLTAPDHRPEGDDRYWFCSRVGCDQKHEEFMDSEAIYKNFVLRVMAARSPSVRLRKALYRKDSSVDPKCPNTVPAKPSRSRVSRLAMISSISHKANNGNIKSKEAKVISSTNKNVTPKAKLKGKDSSVVLSVPQKALTERKKQLRSPAPFRSVQNPRNATVRVSKNRIVAKALVFHSPKKVVKLKRSVEVRSSVKRICNGMRKLDTEKKRNVLGFDLKVVSSVPSRKTLKVREVKSREFDSLRVPKQIGDKDTTRSTLKQKVKEKEEHVLPSDTLKSNIDVQLEARQEIAVKKESGVDKSKEYKISKIEEKENAVAMECKTNEAVREDLAVIKESGVVKAKQHETMETEDKENALPLECDDKENATNAADVDRESDEKENLSALDNNRKFEHHTNPPVKKKVICRKETCKTTQKVMLADKCLNGNTVLATTRVKYTKPKLTNPKPFRLRTDERQILKEANIEKKPKCALAKEEETTNILRSNGENLSPKHQPARLEKNTRGNDSRGMSKKVVRHDDASENMMNPKRVAFGTKKKVASKINKVMEETTPMKGEAMTNKHSVCVVASGEKRLATVPKGPNFHSIHVPKSCTKRVASQV